MGMTRKVIFISFTVLTATVLYKLLLEPHPIPTVEDEYWGPSAAIEKYKEDTTIHPFEINVTTHVLDYLKTRLKLELNSNRIAPPLESVGFNYGFNSNFIKKIGNYWLQKYDWKQREKLLNKYPHFKTQIGGLDIHFQHIKPKPRHGKPPRPLLIIHGWPGSFVEFQKIIPLLSEPEFAKHNYELVIPSLPGYAFSSAAERPGMAPTMMANIFRRLMKRLGHEKFYVMGGDWGSVITSDLATLYPENIIAAQSNWCATTTVIGFARYILATILPDILMTGQEEETAVLPILELASFTVRESGYFHLASTKPNTIGVALTHSPIGLAAYILEKFSTWTNRTWINREDGGLLENFTLDELLDNVMIYWVTGSITSSMRVYAEYADPNKKYHLERVPTDVPYSCQYLPGELAIFPKFALRDKYTNIQNYTVATRGGHFGAFELPALVAENSILHFEKY